MPDNEAARKLSPEAKQLIQAVTGTTGSHDETDVLVRTTRPVSNVDRAALRRLGVTVRTVAGDVLTARLPVDRLAEFAGLPVVAYVEVSRPLH
jgi:hypothetical protein